MFDSSFTWGPHYAHMDMIVSKTKPGLALLCHLSAYLELAGLSKMYEYFIQSCLEYGHLLYFGAAKLPFGCSSALSCQYLSLHFSIFGVTPACCSDWTHMSTIGWRGLW